MTMDKRENVLLALSKCIGESGCLSEPECPYVPQCFGPGRHVGMLPVELVEEIRALLKAQEPRVVSFDEIDNYEVLWFEVRDVHTEEGLAPWVKTRRGRWFSPLLCGETEPDMPLSRPEEYGTICRCWTSRPTDKQREATPWK